MRLELEAHEAAHPALADEAIVEPIFVIGPPRSGTTVLHRHLGAVAGHRVSRG
ncbi:MAG: sulfotransferase, partial [Acidimicrobiaceae bacterium]|nr:sulfotransferase [Acidimicrobiaceae bacterium]